MSDIDFRQPGLGLLRAAAEAAELAHAVSGLGPAYGYRPAGRDQIAPLARARIAVPQATRNLLLDWHGICAGTQQAANTVTGAIGRVFRYAAGPSGSGGARPVTGHRHQDPGAGQ